MTKLGHAHSMPRRPRIQGAAILVCVAMIAAACHSGADGSSASAVGRLTTTTTAPVAHLQHHAHPSGDGHGVLGGADAGALAHRQHDPALPTLTTRRAHATPAERDASTDLLARIRATLAPYESEAAARAAGYAPNPRGRRLIHYRNVANRRDGRELDPEHPEGLVYLRTVGGGLHLLGAVFTVWPGRVAPAPGGDIFFWHTHNSNCGSFLVPAGVCTDTFRMLHVWTAPHAVDPWIQSPKSAFGLS